MHHYQDEIQLSALMVEPMVDRLREWLAAGKLEGEDLEAALGLNAQALLDHPMDPGDWVSLSDVQGMVGRIAAEIGGEVGLSEWAREIAADWTAKPAIASMLASARRLPDAQGFAISQASSLLVRDPEWQYTGGADSFRVCFTGFSEIGSELKSMLGSLFSKLAEEVSSRPFDVRVAGLDGGDFLIFGEAEGVVAAEAESRLHQAALIP